MAVPGNRLRPSQRAFSGTHAQFRYWTDNGSKQAEAWTFGSLRLDDWEYNMGYGDALRDEVHNDNITPLIGIFDMYSASLAAQHYGGMFVSGFGFAASYYGLPDIGFIAWPDMVSFVQRLRLAFPQQHLLVDIDDGYVDPEVACHVVEHLERIGASGVILEDQKRPRRCGHVTGKQILPIEEYLEKLNLVLQTRSELVVMASTDRDGRV
jgi:2-methylisocitrate lyase-like PEP mutase family enzyme